MSSLHTQAQKNRSVLGAPRFASCRAQFTPFFGFYFHVTVYANTLATCLTRTIALWVENWRIRSLSLPNQPHELPSYRTTKKLPHFPPPLFLISVARRREWVTFRLFFCGERRRRERDWLLSPPPPPIYLSRGGGDDWPPRDWGWRWEKKQGQAMFVLLCCGFFKPYGKTMHRNYFRLFLYL